MADALVGATIKVVLEKTISLATERIGLIFGFKKELQSLRVSVEMILAVLADAEYKQGHDKAVQLWLKQLEGVAFDADNALDELNYEFLRRKVESLNQLKGKVCFFFSFSNTKIALRRRMASKVREINMKLKKINQEANDFGLSIRHRIQATPPATAGATTSRQTDSLLAPKVMGRAKDESKIVEMLLSPSDEVVSVIPIVGMGGLGKTTLAKSVYNNPKINEHFKTKIWVCVSENFEVMEVFKLMLESLTRRNVEIVGRDVVVQEIRKQLEEKRYLLVLDDVWNEIPNLWDDFFKTLVGFNSTNGSRCLVTTRLQQVASIVSRHGPYWLGKLSNDDCWSILKENVIAGGVVVPKELNDIRDQIIKRCDGLPLAANVIGSLLRLQRKEEWQSIMESRLLNLSGGESGIEQILKVSFDYLPSASLKKCFAYCSIFAKDTKMERDLLIEIWMAEGFLQPDVENERVMEKVGIKYCEILLQSSLLEEGRKWDGIYYKMHDLVHDLAQFISRSGSPNLENGVISNSYPVRYLALKSFGEETKKVIEGVSTSLRSLFLDSESDIASNMLSKFMNLHVLNLSRANLKELPTSIDKLIHLRFLNFSSYKIATLPESLCKLYNLQTLRIEAYGETLESLPKQMSNLISLRHLHYRNDNAKFQMPLEMGRLTCLQTLDFFNVGQEKGRRIEELGCLGDLNRSLVIRNLELVNGKEGAEGANLCGKPNLSKLKFQWSRNRECDSYDDENVLEGLQPHPNLKKLQIKNYMGDHFPQWFMNLSTILSNLVDLSLINCKRCKEIPALGQLPFLQSLFLSGNVTSIGPSFYVTNGQVSSKLFPALKELSLVDMKNLVEWKEADVTSRTDDDEEVVVEIFPMLESLTIKSCSQLTTVPSHFSSLKKLSIAMNDHVLVASKILSKVTTLESFEIDGMAGLTCVSDLGGFLHNNQSLKYLQFTFCPNLTSIRGCGTSLEKLTISYCNGLTSLSGHMLESCTSLEYLSISYCNGLTSLPGHMLESFASLCEMEIRDCNGLTSLPGHMLESCTSLENLQVYDCPNLVSFPHDFQKTPSLWYLGLYRCPKLMISDMPKGFGFLTRLSTLEIGPFLWWSDDSSIEFDWSGLISLSTLRRLTLYGMPQLESLPDQLQHLTTLTSLFLHDFGGVEALPDWIGNLANLEELGLWDCAKLRYLPSVAAVRRLTKLNSLYIFYCPLLKERCSPQSGPDSEWSKIPHIRRLTIL